MADRYQDRPFPAGDDKGESDPLAELARLIGQTDPFGTMGRANVKVQPRSAPPVDPYPRQPPAEPDDGPPVGPPPWMQRANRQEVKKQVYQEPEPDPEPEENYEPSPVHPLHRYAAQHQHAAPQQDYQQDAYEEETQAEVDPSRYDDALYGQIESGSEDYQRDPAYPDDPYAYQDGYEEGVDDQGERRRGGLITVIAVLALAVIGTGAAFAYRSYVASPRSGDPPIIRADNSPTKIVPSPGDSTNKTPDRMPAGDGTEKIVPREEAPVDINTRAVGPRVVFPQLNQNSNPPSPASVSPGPLSATSPVVVLPNSSGTMPSSEPRRVKTVRVGGDQPDNTADAVNPPSPPPAAPARAARAPRNSPNSANASANGPLSLSPQSADSAPAPAAAPRARVAATTNPVQAEPDSGAASSGFMVQVSSQPSEGVAQASYRALQTKFPAVLGGHDPVIKRAELGDKTVYRAMVGPFGSREEALQLCTTLKSAGGQCFVPKN
jgi:hypothetical protein